MTFAIYPGTFDPITNGHVDIVRRAAGIFPPGLVAVAAGGKKRPILRLGGALGDGRTGGQSCPHGAG